MDIFLNQLVKFYLPINSTHYAKLYPQNGERIVTIDSVTSFMPITFNGKVNEYMAAMIKFSAKKLRLD